MNDINTIKKDDGFTIIELIVGLNISMIFITAFVSFYLFSIKFVSSSTTTLQEKENISRFIDIVDEQLNKADKYTYINGPDYEFIINSIDTLYLQRDKLVYNDIFEIKEIDKYKIDIGLNSGDIITITGGADNKLNSSGIDPGYSSYQIEYISLYIEKNNRKYSYIHKASQTGIRRFKNI